MVLDYIALFFLIVVVALAAYGVVAVYGIPHEIAKARHHPHEDAIGAATWVSLFTLGVMWPFLWIWAMAYRPDRGWGFTSGANAERSEIEAFERRLSALERVASR